MSDSQRRREQSRQRLPSAPHDSPWEHVLSVEHPDLASRHHVEKGTRLQSEIADIDNAFSDTTSPEAAMDQRGPKTWERTKSYESSYSTGTHDRYHTKRDGSNSLQGLHYGNDDSTDTSYPFPAGGNTAPTSHSSPGEMTESSSTMETNFPETVRSNSPPSDSPDTGLSDRGRNLSSQGAVGSRPRPFSRKSKAGIEHTVTPARAGPDGGFICKFSEHGKICGKSFKLPSDIRFHLIEKHMTFSPFQCDKCKRVYTRKSLYTRHLKEVAQDSSTVKRTRQCPHRVVEADESYHIRKETYEALWAIQLSQEQVDAAATIISKHNGRLPGRRRRTQSTNEPDLRDVSTSNSSELLQPASHSSQQTHGAGFRGHQNSSYESQSPDMTYPSVMLRVCSAPNPLVQQSTVAHPVEDRRPSPVPCFNTAQSYDNIPSFQSQQNPNTLPTTQATYSGQYLGPTNGLYGPQPRTTEYFESPRGFSGSSDSIAPHVLHGRQSSWDGSSVESNYEDPWVPGVRGGHNYREPMAFEYSTSPHSEQIQHGPFNQDLDTRRCDFQGGHRDRSPKHRE